jgi:formylglycine-generating enzyme required for sulfatase activity
VWEWTCSREGSARVIRGGCWDCNGVFCSASIRAAFAQGRAFNTLGVRLLAVPSGK